MNPTSPLAGPRSAISNPSSPGRAAREWRLLVGLLLLCTIPVGAGVVRVRELLLGAAITPDNARFFAAPAPVILHVVTASAFALLGGLQLLPGFRLRFPAWHRRVGWLLVVCGIGAALGGLWMQVSYPLRPNPLLAALRWLFGSAWIVCVAQGILAARRRAFVAHGAWMVRAYAIAMGAGTQALLLVPWVVLIGMPPAGAEALLMGLGWLGNLALAEWLLQRGTWARIPDRVG